MPPYTGPSKESSPYPSKFVRVEQTIVVTEAGDYLRRHSVLVREEGLSGQLESVRRTNPDGVDAGTFSISDGRKTIYIRNESSTLDLPMTKKARENTRDLFEKLSPGYSVDADPNSFIIYKK